MSGEKARWIVARSSSRGKRPARGCGCVPDVEIFEGPCDRFLVDRAVFAHEGTENRFGVRGAIAFREIALFRHRAPLERFDAIAPVEVVPVARTRHDAEAPLGHRPLARTQQIVDGPVEAKRRAAFLSRNTFEHLDVRGREVRADREVVDRFLDRNRHGAKPQSALRLRRGHTPLDPARQKRHDRKVAVAYAARGQVGFKKRTACGGERLKVERVGRHKEFLVFGGNA